MSKENRQIIRDNLQEISDSQHNPNVTWVDLTLLKSIDALLAEVVELIAENISLRIRVNDLERVVEKHNL